MAKPTIVHTPIQVHQRLESLRPWRMTAHTTSPSVCDDGTGGVGNGVKVATDGAGALLGETTPASEFSGIGSHIAGLDGIRALAVLAVLGFHGGVPGMAGGNV